MNTEEVEYECSDCHSTIPADVKVCPHCGAIMDEPASTSAEPDVPDSDVAVKRAAIVVEEMKKGTDDTSIAQMLMETGMNQSDASQFVEAIRADAIKTAEQEEITPESYTPAILGAILAAVVGGILWGVITTATDHEIGFMAWGMGWLAGFAVVKLSGGKKGLPFQIIAVASSIAGILIGKFFSFEHALHEEVLKHYGGEVASSVTVFSGKVVSIFFENFGSMLNGYDALWVLLAVVTAWKMPQAIGIKKNPAIA